MLYMLDSHIANYVYGFFNSIHINSVVIKSPQTMTVCRGSDVTISCGYSSSAALPVIWIINGTSFTQQEVVDSPLYQLNNPTSPSTFSLTVFSINSTTTFQCVVQSTTSRRATVTVTNGMYILHFTLYVHT